jgi:RHS repeat-associated protein
VISSGELPVISDNEGTYGPDLDLSLACWSLIGRFGTGTPFEIGSSATVTSTGGELSFGVNDNDFADNSGSWAVQMATGAPPFSVVPDGGALTAAEMRGDGGGADTYCACSTGRPINIATGDYYDTETDLTIPGAGIPLTFNRTYDASAAQAEESSSASAGPLGYGWTDNLNMSVSYNSGTGVATVTQANGSQLTFQYYAEGATEPIGSGGATWCPSDATAGVFCPTAPRYLATLTGASGGTGGPWTFVNDAKSPITYSFSSSGVLTEIADASGDTLASTTYSPGAGQAACPSGDTCVAWASTPAGESTPSAVLVEAFNSSSQLVSVFDAASGAASAQKATFSYTGTGCSTWSGTPADLCSVTDPGSLSTTFTYDTGKSSPYQYDEITMDPPASGDVSNTYNSSGQVSKQIITTGTTNQEQDFAYATNSTVTNGTQTTITDYPNGSSGSSTTSTYVFSNGVEVAETDGTSATTYDNRDPATLLADDTIDGDGNDTGAVLQNYASPGGSPTSSANVIQSTDGVGNSTQAEYTATNLPWCTVDAADLANGTTCPATEPTSPPAAGTRIGYTLTIYNAANEATSTTDPLGNTTANSYTTSGSGVPAGLLYCTVDPADNAKGVTCPAYGATHVAGTATKTFDANGDVLTSTDADGDVTSYTYGSAANPGLPTTTTDPDGAVTTDTYNAEGEVLTQVVTGASGYSATTQYAYNAAGQKWCEVSPYDYSEGYQCPATAPTSPPTGVTGYTDTIYTTNGQVSTTTNPTGGTTQYAYDGAGNRYCTVSAYNYANGTRCPTSLPLTTPTPGSDSYLGATIDTFNADNEVTQVTNPLGGITASTYDPAGNLQQTTVESNNTTSDPNVVTEYSYDADNRVASTTVGYGTSLAATTKTSYDPNGNAFCTVSANAVAAGSSTYQCPTWQPGWIVTPPSPSALYSTSPTSAQANNVTTDFFNADGDQVQTTNPDIRTSISAFDADGQTYCTSDPVNVAAWLTANSSGTYPYLCPSSAPTTAPTTATGYVTTIFDAAGRTLSTTDQVGDTTSYAYDPAGHTTTTTDPRGKVTSNCYYWESGTGQCAAGAPAGGGSADDLYSTTTPPSEADSSGETTTYTYYPGDTAETTTNPAGTTTDTYDANGDLTNETYSNTASGFATPTNVTYTYNPDGSRLAMVDATGTTTYGYDDAGDQTSQQLTATATGLTSNVVDHGYFTTGVLASTTYPSYSGHTTPVVNYTYDATGAMTSETDWLGNEVTVSHDADGNGTGQDNAVSGSNPSGTSSTSYSYDSADENTGAVSTLSCSGGSAGTFTQSFSGTTGFRNADGQLTEDSETYAGSCAGPATAERNYSYDQAGRVVYQGTTAQGSSANDIAYDASGDPTTISSHDSSGNFDTYSQSFDPAGEDTLQYPVSGSSGVNTTYTYDTLGDLTQSTTSSSTANYGYNQLGQMTSYSTPSTTDYQYTGDGLEAAATTPGGVSWSSATDIDSTRAIDAETCVSATFCVAVGASGYTTTYNGTTWSTPTDADSSRTMDAVSCVSSTFCVAVDTAGYATTYNGTTWSTPSDIDSTRSVNAVTCVSSTFCVAVGASGYAATYNGTTWATATDADSSRSMDALSCVSSTFCIAVDTAGYAVKYTGSWGTPADADSTRSITTIHCSSTTSCVAAGASGYATTYNGSTWATPTDADGSRTIVAMSCPSTTSCVVVDSSGYATSFNGTSWASTPLDIDGSTGLKAISCPATNLCEATDSAGNVLSYNGSLWSTPSNIDATRSLTAVSCPISTFCVATDGSGYGVVHSLAASWGTPAAVDPATIKSVSCVSATFCAAVGSEGSVLTFNGTSWTSATSVGVELTLDSVSCASATLCAAVDTNGFVTTYNGTSWSLATDIDASQSINAVDCPATGTFCLAVGSGGQAVEYRGGGWSRAGDADSSRTMDAVSCVSATFCVAVDTSGYATTYNGTTWSTPTDIDSTRSVNSVDCVSTTFCVAAGASGYAATYNGTTWATATDADSTRTITAVTCTSTTFCIAVDSSGYAVKYSGSWGTPTDVDGSHALEALSCASSTMCDATDNTGNVVTYTGSSWSAASDIDGSRSVTGVSCPVTTFCVATDTTGYAVVYQPPLVTAQMTWDTSGSLPLVLSDATNDYIYGPNNEPVEQVNLSSSTPTYLTYTASDSSWLATNNAGQQVAFWRYDAFGNLATGTPDSPFGYSGQYTDASTGLVNDRARFYESQTGSFTTRDPAFSSTDTAYAYSGGDPVNQSDPNGQFTLCVGPLCTPNLHWQFQPGNIGKAAANFGAGAANAVIGLVNAANAGGPQSGYFPTYQGSCGSLLGVSTVIGALAPGLATIPFGAEGLAGDISEGVAGEAVTGVTAALPPLTGTIAESFEDGVYESVTFKTGTAFYRAEGEDQGIGSFLGLSKPSTAQEAEKLYNIAGWDNKTEVVSTYRLVQDQTMYVGKVAGGSGIQALLPQSIDDPSAVLEKTSQEVLP